MRLDQIAAQTWNQERRIEETSAAIHDGAVGEDALAERGRFYVEELIFGSFPQAVPGSGAAILEIGSGLGWIMQAMNTFLIGKYRPPCSVTGLDIAPNMIEQAKQRLGTAPPFGFLLYDGITVPAPDASLDLIYSVAALQHVPRPFVFNLFFEMKRLLMPGAYSVFHLLSTEHLKTQEKWQPWRHEISNQIAAAQTHWHHFYTEKELRDVLTISGFSFVDVKPVGDSLMCCVAP
jgi:ubiquinone/menaquinone biosynthesis C-methylase UbiE